MDAFHQFLTLFLIWTLLSNLTFYPIARGVHRIFATGVACQQRTLTPPDTWSCLTYGLASVMMLRSISPELVLFTGLLSCEHPSVLLFLLLTVLCIFWPRFELAPRYFALHLAENGIVFFKHPP